MADKSYQRFIFGANTVDADLFDTEIYHTQQCAEKALKGYLVFQQQQVFKTHDLVELLKQCYQFDGQFWSFLDSAKILTPYAVEFRYPDDVISPDEADVVDAIKRAQAIIDFVKNKIHT